MNRSIMSKDGRMEERRRSNSSDRSIGGERGEAVCREDMGSDMRDGDFDSHPHDKERSREDSSNDGRLLMYIRIHSLHIC